MAEAVAESRPVSTFDLFQKSYAAVRRNPKPFILLNLPWLLLELGHMFGLGLASQNNNQTVTSGPPVAETSDSTFATIFGLVLVIIVALALVSLLLLAMTYILELASAQGKKPTMGELFRSASKYIGRLFRLGLTVGLVTAGGFLLLIIPGLICIRRYFLSPYLMIDKDLGVREAMKQSAAISKPYSGAIWSVIGVTMLVYLTGVLPIIGGLVSLVLGVIYSVAPALRYEELKKLG